MPPKAASSRGEYIETLIQPNAPKETGNKISRRAIINGTPHIVLAGKSVIQHDVLIRGDLVRQQPLQQLAAPQSSLSVSDSTNTKPTTTSSAAIPSSVSIHLGRYVFVSPHCILHPPSRLSSVSQSSSSTSHPPAFPQQRPTQILTYLPLRIGDFTTIGPYTTVHAASIGSHVTIGAHCVVGNLVIIKDGVRVEDYTVLPAASVWASGSVVAGRPARVVGEVGEGWASVEGGPGGGERERYANIGPAGGKGKGR